MSNISVKEIKRNLINYIQLNDKYMDIDAEYTDEQEDAILDEMENLVSTLVNDIYTFTYGNISKETAETMVKHYSDQLMKILEKY